MVYVILDAFEARFCCFEVAWYYGLGAIRQFNVWQKTMGAVHLAIRKGVNDGEG